ncbi:MAG: DUF447 family protein [Acidobacteria bacterium]|nr:DUF447 family protein [Acidobacteriota bacterium]
MIIETVFSTINEMGTPNFAPMGIEWNGDVVFVRPFRDTQTCRNLYTGGYGVASFSDNVLAYVQCCLYGEVLEHFPASSIPGVVMKEACTWLELAVTSQGGDDRRAEFQCRVLYKGRHREFLGFCRASNSVIEAAIMATRLDFLDPKKVVEHLNHYMKIVDKTGDEKDKQAIHLVREYIRKREAL